MLPIQKYLLLFIVTALVPSFAHAALSDAQKQVVIEAIEKGDYAVLDILNVDEDPAPNFTLASSLKIDRPGTYEFGGQKNVDISRNAARGGLRIEVPTCPKPYRVVCQL